MRKRLRKGDEVKGYNTKRHLIYISLLSVLIFLAYSNSLNGTWALDDVLVNRPVGINSIHDLIGFRKVAYLTFLFNQFIAPFTPVSFRLFNIIIHILNTLLIYILAYKTIIFFKGHEPTQRGGKKKIDNTYFETNQAFYVAVLSSIIFAMHPLNINAVAYIIQRMASLATFFVLLSLIFYISAVRSRGMGKAAISYALSLLLLVLGIFSKENAIVGIPLIILFDYVFLSGEDKGSFKRRLLVISCVWVLIMVVISYLLNFHNTAIQLFGLISHPSKPMTRQGWMAVDVYWTPVQHILTEFRVVSRYIYLIFLPLPGFLVFDWWSFPISRSLIQPVTTFLSAIFLLSLFVFSIIKIKRYPFLCFGILWYFISISVVTFFAIGSDLYFEHRNYMPLAGLVIGMTGHLVVSLKLRFNAGKFWVVVVLLGMVLGSLTFTRNFVWRDSLTLWKDTLDKAPSNLRAMMSMGNAYMKLSDTENAERYYKGVLGLSEAEKRPYFFSESAFSLGMLYLFNQRLDEARDLIERFKNTAESYKIRILNGYYMALNGYADDALKEYMTVINETSGLDRVIVLTLMGDAYREKGLLDNAIKNYNRAIEIEPDFAAAYYGIGASYLRKADIDKAYRYLRKTLSIDPDHVLALSDMSDVLLIKRRNPQEAFDYAQRAVLKDTPFYQPYFTMANLLLFLGREVEADGYYKKAVEHGMKEYMVPFGMARTYYLKGDKEKAGYYIKQLHKYQNLPEGIRDLDCSNSATKKQSN